MTNTFDQNIPELQEGIKYDPDSSPLTWKHYRKVYKEHWDLIKHFELENLKKCKTRLLARISAKSEYSKAGNFWPEFKIGGDTDFNFNENKFPIFEKIINPEQDHNKKDKLHDQLKECRTAHHTLKNFSLMPTTGAMNNFKGLDRFDRFDRFDRLVYHLNEHFRKDAKETSEILDYAAARKNKEPLENFLTTFGDVYAYCKKVYFIEDKNFINRIIHEGQLPLKSPDDVARYMKLAQDYWELRKESFQKIYDKRC